jgi:hypothetical protein
MSAQRKPKTKPAAASRFSKIGAKGTPLPADATEWDAVLDTKTGLVWAREPIKVSNWKPPTVKKIEAQLKASRLGGFDDWRIPTVEELFPLADRTRVSPAIDVDFFPDCPSDWFWTSTLHHDAPAGYAWGVSFDGGGAGCGDRCCGGFVRAVRGGQ